MTDTAIIAGAGALPAALAAALPARPLVAALEGYAPEGLAPDAVFRVERLVPFLNDLLNRGIRRVCFAGAVQRPRLDPSLFDPLTAQMVPRLITAMGQGDDATLREVVGIFEDTGLSVVGVQEIAPALVPGAGVLCGLPSKTDERDADRAALIVEALGRVDVGQGAVVQQGLCLAVEALPGTDAMLAGVAALTRLRPDPARGKGVFYKAPKPLQDRRIDLPAIGPQTVEGAAAAGLAGIVWQAGGVIALDQPAMRAAATAHGLFLWAR
ncbi:MAG: UDP-2,3-diacylglucosamine diphosphatase LpxI [Paracoccaceae bacterium]